MTCTLRTAVVLALAVVFTANAQDAAKKDAPAKAEPAKEEAKAAPAEKEAKPAPAKKEAAPAPVKAEAPAEPAANAPAADDGVTVERLSVCTGIVDREPDGAAESFPASVGKLYCFSHVKGVQGTLPIEHKWYKGDNVVSAVTLTVKSPSWRTYSSKTIDPMWTGEWRVEVVNTETGAVMNSTTFTLQ